MSLVFFCCQTRYNVLTFSHLKLVFTTKNLVIKSYQIEVSVLQSFSVHKTARIGTNSPFRLESSSSDGTDAKRNENGTKRKRYEKFRCTIVVRCKNVNFFLAATVLAVVTFIDHFRQYLLGRQFLLRTDHHSLTCPKTMRDS